MVPATRSWFNTHFTEEKYRQYLQYLTDAFPGALDFRVAETPVFVNRRFKEQMLQTCEFVVDTVLSPGFRALTQPSLPPHLDIEGEEGRPSFMVFDFAISQGSDGECLPQLVEMQGFPSLFAYQLCQDEAARKAYGIPQTVSPFLNGYNKSTVVHKMQSIILDGHAPEHTILLDLHPEKQKTKIDFYATRSFLHIPVVGLDRLVRHGNRLYYLQDGREIAVERIYNRLIWDDIRLHGKEEDKKQLALLSGNPDVEWVEHPDWFYRISKYLLPFLRHPCIPETYFLHTFFDLPDHLEDYVLKPLYSFAGQGIVLDIRPADIYGIPDPENYILQRKIAYAPVIATPDGPARAEIRIFYMWEKGSPRPVATHNLARLTKDDMIGVGFNKNKKWVGGSITYFEEG